MNNRISSHWFQVRLSPSFSRSCGDLSSFFIAAFTDELIKTRVGHYLATKYKKPKWSDLTNEEKDQTIIEATNGELSKEEYDIPF